MTIGEDAYLAIQKQRPSSWDNPQEWDQYYSAYHQARLHLDPSRINFELFEAFLPFKHIIENQFRKIWFPGCGVTLAPHVYAALGFRVWASDFSKEAVRIQEELRQIPLKELITNEGVKQKVASVESRGELHLCVHNFQEPFEESDFDCIVNIKSFQGLSAPVMLLAARSYYTALRPQGQAFFLMLNVKSGRRNAIEKALIEAGFTIPWHRLNFWWRFTRLGPEVPPLFLKGLSKIVDSYNRPRGLSKNEAVESHEKRKLAYLIYNTG